MQNGSFGSLIGWKSGQTTYVPLWDRMEGAWLWTPGNRTNRTKNEPNKRQAEIYPLHNFIYSFSLQFNKISEM
jgi:hypothetical protein